MLLVGCATTGKVNYSTPEWTWSDGESERAAIQCAAEKMYGPEFAAALSLVPVRTFPDYPFPGLNYGGIIGLNAGSPTARSSAWSHEAVHWLERERTDRWTLYPKCLDEPFYSIWQAFELTLDTCRAEAAGGIRQ